MRLALLPRLLALAVAAPVVLSAVNTAAQEVPTPTPPPRARWHPDYLTEVDAHLIVGGLESYSFGVGVGARFTVPIWENAPFRHIDDTVAVGIGVDVVRYGGYNPTDRDRLGHHVLTYAYYVPLFAQWNWWAGARFSAFVEPTLIYRFAAYADSCSGLSCASTSRVLPTGFVGLRGRLADHVSITIRVGWPMAHVGISWL